MFFSALFRLRPGRQAAAASAFATHLGTGPGREGGTRAGFTLNRGELPNLIQFMAATGRTGRLSLEYVRSGRRGAVYFREGAVTHVHYADFQGRDGLARMLNEGLAETSFVEDVCPGETNVAADSAALLLEAATVAEELAKAAAASAGMASPAATGPAHPSGLDHGTAHRVQALAAAIGRVGRVGTQVVLVLAVFLLVFGGGYWGCWKVWQRYNRAEERALRAWNDEQKKFWDEQRRKREEALNLDGFTDVAQLKAEAENRAEKLAAVDAGQGLGELREAVEVALRLGHTLFAAKKYTEASRAYTDAVVQAQQLLTLDRQRQQAAVQQAEAGRLRAKAESAGAPTVARLLWERAEALATAAQERFQGHDFPAAAAQWLAAATQYQRAETHAVLARAVLAARDEYEAELRGTDVAILKQYGGKSWEDAQNHAAAAAGEQSSGDLAAASDQWRAAQVLVRRAIATAAKTKSTTEFRSRLSTAQQLLARNQWEKAEALFAEAQALPGYGQDETVIHGLRTCRRERWLAAAEQAKAKGRWDEVLRCAEEVLTVDPFSLPAQALIKRAQEALSPQLSVRATGDGEPIATGRVALDGEIKEGEFPLLFRVEPGRTYAVRVEVPVQGSAVYSPYSGTYQTRKEARQELVVPLVHARAPEPRQRWTVPGLDQVMVPVAAGRFRMGSAAGREDERPVHSVTVSRPFWLGQTEVTNRQYRRFLRDCRYEGNLDANNLFLLHLKEHSDISSGDECPVCYVSWLNAAAFCTWLNQVEARGERLPPGYVYRLPTEAEWEYACRAGTDGDFAGEVNRMAVYEHNSRTSRPVAACQANAWGLYDMHGNVWEWCLDWRSDYTPGEQKDPCGPLSGPFKVLRGGSWQSPKALCRSATRHSASRYESDATIGFRVALAPEIPGVWTLAAPPLAEGSR